MYSFDRNPTTGLPCTTVSLTSSRTCTYPSWAQSAAILAEYGTMQLEFKYLSHHTGERKYWDAVEKPIRLLQRTSHPHHLYPTFINPKTGRWSSNKITFGALGDSFYEYLIKQWLLTGKQEEWLRTMYDETMVEPTSDCAAFTPRLAHPHTARDCRYDETMVGMAAIGAALKPSGYVYVADWSGSSLQHKMDHLACFSPPRSPSARRTAAASTPSTWHWPRGSARRATNVPRMKTGLARIRQFTSRDEAGLAVFASGGRSGRESLRAGTYPGPAVARWGGTSSPPSRRTPRRAGAPPAAAAARAPPPPTAAARRPPRAGVDGAADVNTRGGRDDKMESFVLAETPVHLPPLRPRLPDPAREVRDEHRGAPARAHPAAVGRGRAPPPRRRSCESIPVEHSARARDAPTAGARPRGSPLISDPRDPIWISDPRCRARRAPRLAPR